MGSPDFAAPELFQPGVTADHRADIYGVGATLYQMLTGTLPRGFFRLPSELRPGIDSRFDTIVVKAMEADRDERYQNAMELREALSEVRAPACPAQPAKPPKRFAAVATMALALAALVAFGGWWATRDRDPKPAASHGKPANPPPTVAWTDWLTPKLADSAYFTADAGWKREEGGLTMLKEIAGHEVLPPTTRDGAVRMTYLLRNSKGPNLTVRERRSNGDRELYCADDKGDSLWLFRKDLGSDLLHTLASTPIPPEISRTAERTLEFRVAGDTLTATLNGAVRVTAKDNTVTEGLCAMVLTRDVLVKKLETDGGAEWTDWLARQLASGFYGHPQDTWKREAGGVTTFVNQAGDQVLPPGTRDGAIRMTYLLRGEVGPNITIRDRGEGGEQQREHYCAEDTGGILYLFRKDAATNSLIPLVSRPIPFAPDPTQPRTLEIRFVGDTLTVTLNGTFAISTKDSTLAQGPCAVVLRKDVLVTKVEVSRF